MTLTSGRTAADKVRFAALTTIAVLVAPTSVRAGTDSPRSTPSSVCISAVRARSIVIVDGILDEPAWSTPPTSSFHQRDPIEDAPPSESTDVRILYDDSSLYIGIRLSDREAGQIGRRLSRRDEEPDADAVQVYLSPRHDGRTGAMFEVTAAGVQRDALIFNDASLDFSWDAVWDSAVAIDERGWTAEIRIPLSQLRFADNGTDWGINFARYIRRRNETDWLELVPKRETRLASRMADLTGLGGLHAAPRMEVVSHAVTRDVSGVKMSPTPGALAGALGVDVKTGLGHNLTFNATVNPDFAQVEGDPAVVNLTSFETFFEERRPFFTESAPLFQTYGNAGGAFDASAPVLFYSRRIGEAPPENGNVAPLDRPSATPVIGAFKLDGGIGSNWKVALVDAVTGTTEAPSTFGPTAPPVETAPLTNFTALRLLHTNDRGGIGALATAVARDQPAPSLSTAFVPKRALVGGVDGYAFLDSDQQWVVGGQLSASHLSWTPFAPAPAEAAVGSTSAATVRAAEIHRLLATPYGTGGPPLTNPGNGPPSSVPGNGPPSSVPGNGPPSSVPGTGPPSSVPGVGPPSSVPGVGPPSTAPAAGPPTSAPPVSVSPVADIGSGNAGGSNTLNQNTGTNRVLDLSLGRLDGWSANANFHRNAGAVRMNVDAWAISPGFETNDLGFQPRADIQGLQAQVSWNKFDPDNFTRFRSVGFTKGWTRTFAGETQSDTIDVWTSATFLNYWSAGGGASLWRQAFNATLTRGGPSVMTPAGRSWWSSAGTDPRRAISLEGGAFHSWNDAGDWSSSAWVGVTVKPASHVTVSIGPAVDRSYTNAQYVTTVDTAAGAGQPVTPHYVFATLSASDVALTTRVSVIATSRLSFQVYAQPFVANGQYTGFKELTGAAGDRFLRYGVDLGSIHYDQPTAQYGVQQDSRTGSASFQFDDPAFAPAFFDLHAVARWEWRRGSALYLVWTEHRSGSTGIGPATLLDLNHSFNAPADNAVAAKITYWFGR